MENKQVHYEIFIFDLNKMFKTMNIHFNDEQLDIGMQSQDCAQCSTILYTA